MKNSRSTKRALLSSVIALLVCFTMLLGTTYAWFTDTAVSANNKIVAGVLDVELWQHSAEGDVRISDSKEPVFTDDIIWEPGMTETVYLSIRNNGNLELKYKVMLVVTEVSNDDLTEVMEYAITPDAKYGVNDIVWGGNGVKVEATENETQAIDVVLQPGDEHFFALSVHMLETAGNEFMAESISFDIKVLAGQAVNGDETYDALAEYPNEAFATVDPNAAATQVDVTNEEGYKAGSAVIPAGAIADDATKVSVKISPSTYTPNITIAAGSEKKTVDVKVEGLKENNTELVKVSLKIEAGLDPATVKVYHYNDLVPGSTYNPNTGYVTFETAEFSPFTVVFDAQSEYVPPVAPAGEYPVATVTYASEHVNADIDWGNYGQWSPTAGLDSKLESAFVFACPENLDPEVEAAYEYWYCDFYVSLDEDLGANQLFLGGNYGSFGWVGFHNGDLELPANTEIGLLESVTTNPWTYADVRDYVGEFTCGVGDVNDALNGATFTVKLRLTNPANTAEFYDVNVVTYTFGGNYTIQ